MLVLSYIILFYKYILRNTFYILIHYIKSRNVKDISQF